MSWLQKHWCGVACRVPWNRFYRWGNTPPGSLLHLELFFLLEGHIHCLHALFDLTCFLRALHEMQTLFFRPILFLVVNSCVEDFGFAPTSWQVCSLFCCSHNLLLWVTKDPSVLRLHSKRKVVWPVYTIFIHTVIQMRMSVWACILDSCWVIYFYFLSKFWNLPL